MIIIERLFKTIGWGLAAYFLLFQSDWLWLVIESILYSEPSEAKANVISALSQIRFVEDARLRIIDIAWIVGKSVIILFVVSLAWELSED